MFTGLIQTQGEIREIVQQGDRVMTIAMDAPFPAKIGDSIACHGICLTVTKLNGSAFDVSLSAETLNRSTSGTWAKGQRINLEPSLHVGDAMGGHFVSGHVDGLGKVTSRTPSGDSTIWEFELAAALGKFVAEKGSITIDGVSLTVNSVRDVNGATRFTVNIIPHTAQVTSFGTLNVGDSVNIEIDMLARYAARLSEATA